MDAVEVGGLRIAYERAGTGPPPGTVDAFGKSMRAFHPTGFRAMARASAESVREVLPRIDVPTLLVDGDQDVRAPMGVADGSGFAG